MTQDMVTIPADRCVTRLTAESVPVLAVSPGDPVRFLTSDRSYTELTSEAIDGGQVDFRQINLMTGPVAVNGAEPGDALGFEIQKITISADAHVLYVASWKSGSFGLPGSEVLHLERTETGIRVGESITLPLRPMIGCMATAPARGVLSSLSPCRSTGGNLDIPELREGTVVWLPVRLPQALFSLGDLHASMGRGEPVGSGLETGGEVVGIFHLRKRTQLPGIRFESRETIGFVGSHATDIRSAKEKAVRAAWTWLVQECSLGEQDALAVSAALLDLTMGGPAGANVVASFEIESLRNSGLWPTPLRETPDTIQEPHPYAESVCDQGPGR